MTFIFSLIIIYFVFRIVFYIATRVIAYKMKKRGGSVNEETKDTAGSNKKKIFHQDDGEYVDFEEVDKK